MKSVIVKMSEKRSVCGQSMDTSLQVIRFQLLEFPGNPLPVPERRTLCRRNGRSIRHPTECSE